MKYEASSRRKKGGLSDDDDRGCGRLAMTADTDEEREFLTALYFVNAPALPNNERRQRELKALSSLQKWITRNRKLIRKGSNHNE